MLETGLMFGGVVIGLFIGQKLFGIGGAIVGSLIGRGIGVAIHMKIQEELKQQSNNKEKEQ